MNESDKIVPMPGPNGAAPDKTGDGTDVLTHEQKIALINRAIEQLRPHFDAVQILAAETAEDDRNAIYHAEGRGNMYLRVKIAEDFAVRFEESARESVRSATARREAMLAKIAAQQQPGKKGPDIIRP